MWYIQVCFWTSAHAHAHAQLLKNVFQGSLRSLLWSIPARTGAHEIDGIYTSAFAEQTRNCVVLLNLLICSYLFPNPKIQTAGIRIRLSS